MLDIRQDRLAVCNNPQVWVNQRKGVDAVGRSPPEPPPHRVRLSHRRGRRYQRDIVLVHRNQLLRTLVCGGRATAIQRVRIHGILPANNDMARLLVHRHAPNTTPGILDRLGRLAVTLSRDDQLQYPRCGGNEQGRQSRLDMELDARDRLVRLVDDALLRAKVVDQVAADNSNSAIGEPDRNLRQVLRRGKGRDLCSRQPRPTSHPRNQPPTGNGFFPLLITTVLRHVGIPVFLTGLSSAHTFSTG